MALAGRVAGRAGEELDAERVARGAVERADRDGAGSGIGVAMHRIILGPVRAGVGVAWVVDGADVADPI